MNADENTVEFNPAAFIADMKATGFDISFDGKHIRVGVTDLEGDYSWSDMERLCIPVRDNPATWNSLIEHFRASSIA